MIQFVSVSDRGRLHGVRIAPMPGDYERLPRERYRTLCGRWVTGRLVDSWKRHHHRDAAPALRRAQHTGPDGTALCRRCVRAA